MDGPYGLPEQLTRWIDQAGKTAGNHEVLLLVGSDGVHVPMQGKLQASTNLTLKIRYVTDAGSLPCSL